MEVSNSQSSVVQMRKCKMMMGYTAMSTPPSPPTTAMQKSTPDDKTLTHSFPFVS